MELQLAAILVSLIGGILLLLVMMNERMKVLVDAVEALLELRAELLVKQSSVSEQSQGWLRRVQEVQDEVMSIKARHHNNHLYYFSKFSIGGLAEQQLKQVRELREQGKMLLEAALATAPPLPVVPVVQGTMRTCLEHALRFLGDSEGMLGIWGMGGVGKTTVLKQVLDSYSSDQVGASFDHVLFLVASKECTVRKIQKEIMSVLGLREALTEQSQAIAIRDFLRDKSFLLLLDDLWERLDLERVGIPQPLGAAAGGRARKVILATRSEAVCGDMECRRKIKMECLEEEDAWSLFQEKVGAAIINCNPQISLLAKRVAAECKGLPLAIVTIGRGMSSKRSPEEWENALDMLKKYSQLSGIAGADENSTHRLLKLSYDNLESDIMRECFLICSLWPEDHSISKDELIQCFMGLGLIPEFDDDVDEAYRFGYSLVGRLEAACMLEQGSNQRYNACPSDGHVKMHDVIRDMALWIASSEHKWLVRAGVGLREPPRDEMLWRKVQRVSLMHNHIEDVAPMTGGALSSAEPTSLMLQHNRALPVPRMFQAIRHFSKLTYLELEETGISDAFPVEICGLVKLQYLNLSRNRIQSLPIELGNLIDLKYLYLRDNYYVQITVPPGLIAQLGKLQVLDLFTTSIVCIADYIAPVVGDLESTGMHLKSLGIWLDKLGDVQRLASLPGVRTRSLHLRKLEGVNTFMLLSGRHSSEYGGVQKTLKELVVYASDFEKVVADGHLPRLEVLKFGFLPKLHTVVWTPHVGSSLRELGLGACHALSHLTWVQHLPCLEVLNISGCNGMTRVIGTAEDEESAVVTFPRLKLLSLLGLPKLAAICDRACAFPELRRVQARGCPKLRSIPMKPVSKQSKMIRVECDRHWWDGLLWAGDDVKSYFVAVF